MSALREDVYGTFRTPDTLKPGQTYSVVSYLPNLTPDELKQDPYVFNPPDENAAYIDHSALSQQAHDLAVRVTRDHSSNQFDLVMALTSYLQQNYQYTQQLGPLDDEIRLFQNDWHCSPGGAQLECMDSIQRG